MGRLIPGPKVTDFRFNVGLEIGSLMEHLGSVNTGVGGHLALAIWLPWTLTVSG